MSLAAVIGDFERILGEIFTGKVGAVIGEPNITITAAQAKAYVDAFQSFPIAAIRAFADNPTLVGAIDITEDFIEVAETIDPNPVLKVADMALKLAALAILHNRSALPGAQLGQFAGGTQRRGSTGG